MDMKYLQDILQQTDNLAQMEANKKKQLKEEMHMYKAYLQEQRKEEEKREKELDSMVQAEVCVCVCVCVCACACVCVCHKLHCNIDVSCLSKCFPLCITYMYNMYMHV